MKNIKFIKLADIVLIFVIVLILVFAYAFFKKEVPLKATVYVEGKVHSVYVLDGKREETVTVGKVKIIINSEGIGITDSDCPDKLCVKSGMLNRNGTTVACVPNKIVITVTSSGGAVDGVTG